MSQGREEKKNLRKNGRVIRLFSMPEIAFCLQSYVALKPGPEKGLTMHCCWMD